MTRRGKRYLFCALRLMALLATLAYAGLLPDHLVSQFSAEASRDIADADGHGAHANHCDPDAPKKSDHAPAKKVCPFCAGYAAFQLAALGSPSLLAPPPDQPGVAIVSFDETGFRQTTFTPQSRGPPLTPV